MEFMSAVKAMKEGKKVKRDKPNWKNTISLDKEYNHFIWDTGGMTTPINFSPEDIEATDWQIVEEEKTLSDYIIYMKLPREDGYENMIPMDEVEQFIKDIRADIEKKANKQMEGTSQEYIRGLRYVKEIINKRAGERLI